MDNEILSKYKNGNVSVTLMADGSKIRETVDDEFRPDFAENIDITISTRCSHGCDYCYAGCTPNGKAASLEDYKIFDTVPKGTEIAININSEFLPGFEKFLEHMKNQGVFVNATIRQDDFEENYNRIIQYCKKKLLRGVGISLLNPTPLFIRRALSIPNAVVHVINGIVTKEQLDRMADVGLKLLILGYKNVGRGVGYQKKQVVEIRNNYTWLKENLDEYIPKFNVVAFDNLSLEQLEVRNRLSEEEWERFYQGDEGTSTFFLNLADGYYARDSLSKVHYPIRGTVVDMFHVIQDANR